MIRLSIQNWLLILSEYYNVWNGNLVGHFIRQAGFLQVGLELVLARMELRGPVVLIIHKIYLILLYLLILASPSYIVRLLQII